MDDNNNFIIAHTAYLLSTGLPLDKARDRQRRKESHA
jgi:hypothetical protein